MNELFSHISYTIRSRRSVKPFTMNGNKIPHEQIDSLLELARWAPNHGSTEPWRFIVYSNPADFCHEHAALYKANTPEDQYIQGTYDNLYNQGNKVSHAIVAIMERGNLPKIPVFEEEWATAAAIHNILLGTAALNIASFWASGGMILKPAMHSFLKLKPEDRVMGVIYLGYTDEYPKGLRKKMVGDMTEWR